jgi:hypothetical protein
MLVPSIASAEGQIMTGPPEFVSGGMKVVESWRFEIPFSSAAFSSDPSR